MIKKILKIRGDRKGTALLIALLVMGVLIAVSIALFGLLFREIRSTKTHIDAGKAYYAAESGVEEALYYLNTKLPGWEGEPINTGEINDKVNFEYSINNRCGSYPCIDPEEYDVMSILSLKPEKLYEQLDLSQNTIIPMFVVETDDDGNENVKSVKNFVVQFFAGFNPNKDLNISGDAINGWDVLRWKIFGMKKDGDNYVTDSIDDFTAVSTAQNSVGDDFDATAKAPSWFGSYDCSSLNDGELNFDTTGKITVIGEDGIRCVPYSDVVESVGGSYCSNTQARDYYNYQDGKMESIIGCYDIYNFMDEHMASGSEATGLNYISLTNMMNPAMFKTDLGNYQEKRDYSKIFFRIEAFDDMEIDNDTDQFVRDTAKIISSGFSSGDTKQSIEVQLKRGTYMPVFNFAIYSTYKKSGETFYQEAEE